jgi:hypothetical protein
MFADPVSFNVPDPDTFPLESMSKLFVTAPVLAVTVICSKPPSDLTGPLKVELAISPSSEN